MFCLDWLHAGRATRGKPRRERQRRRSWPATGFTRLRRLAAERMSIRSVCQLRRRQRAFRSVRILQPGLSPGSSTEPTGQPIAASSGVVTEGTVVDATPRDRRHPRRGSQSIHPERRRGSIVPPGSTDSSTELNPATPVDPTAKSKIVSPPGNGAARSAPDRKARATRLAARILVRGSHAGAPRTAITTTVTTPEPTARSAQAPTRTDSGGQTAGEPDPLDNIPPLDLPGDVPRSSATPPVPPAAPGRLPSQQARQPRTSRTRRTRRPPADASELELTSITLPAPEPASSRERRAGAHSLRRRRPQARRRQPSLDRRPRLAGRERLSHPARPSRIRRKSRRAFIAEVTKRGLRYIALPIGPGSIDREHVATVQLRSRRRRSPAALLLRLRRHPLRRPLVHPAHRHRPRRPAGRTKRSRGAGTLGPEVLVGRDQVRLHACPARHAPRRTRTTTRPAPRSPWPSRCVSPEDEPGPKTAAAALAKPETNPKNALPVFAPAENSLSGHPSRARASRTIQRRSQPPVDAALPGKPFAWRSFAAMIVTCLGLPLAYWSRNLAPANRARTRASLPAPAQRS